MSVKYTLLGARQRDVERADASTEQEIEAAQWASIYAPCSLRIDLDNGRTRTIEFPRRESDTEALKRVQTVRAWMENA